MTRLILPICIISLLSGCQDANPAEGMEGAVI